jgi:hypothetical protein
LRIRQLVLSILRDNGRRVNRCANRGRNWICASGACMSCSPLSAPASGHRRMKSNQSCSLPIFDIAGPALKRPIILVYQWCISWFDPVLTRTRAGCKLKNTIWNGRAVSIIKRTMGKTIKTLLYAADSSFVFAITSVSRAKTTIFREMRTVFFIKTIVLFKNPWSFTERASSFSLSAWVLSLRAGSFSSGPWSSAKTAWVKWQTPYQNRIHYEKKEKHHGEMQKHHSENQKHHNQRR